MITMNEYADLKLAYQEATEIGQKSNFQVGLWFKLKKQWAFIKLAVKYMPGLIAEFDDTCKRLARVSSDLARVDKEYDQMETKYFDARDELNKFKERFERTSKLNLLIQQKLRQQRNVLQIKLQAEYDRKRKVKRKARSIQSYDKEVAGIQLKLMLGDDDEN